MSITTPRFKELCLDTSVQDESLGRFWAALTGVRFEPDPPWPGDVVGDEEGMGIAICPVPEAKTVKNRVHLDVNVSSLDEVTALGATLQTGHEHWTVCADPEGNEFCAFVRDGVLSAYRVYELNVDAADAEAIARWWGAVLGVEARNDGQDWWWLEGVPGMPFESWVFGPVPEPKTVKNRMHWDLYGDADWFVERGASRLWDTPGWIVLADPEGNEFCVFPPRE